MSELSAFVACADGYTGAPNVTCPIDEDYYGYASGYYAELSGCDNIPPAPSADPEPDRTTSAAIVCADVDPNLRCNALLLVDEIRYASSLNNINIEVFGPCVRVRDEHPDWSPAIFAGACPTGGGR